MSTIERYGCHMYTMAEPKFNSNPCMSVAHSHRVEHGAEKPDIVI